MAARVPIAFAETIAALREHHGKPKPPPRRDPLAWILHENVAYLVDDARRDRAFALLQERVGITARAILDASTDDLREVVAAGGILAPGRLQKLLAVAELAEREHGGDLRPLLAADERKALRALARFPGIGVPGAEKVLLFCRARPIPALESNGLRVLTRLGFGQEERAYAATYRSVRAALAGQLPRECTALIEAHQLLRRHGQTVCKRTRPDCPACPLRTRCAFAAEPQA